MGKASQGERVWITGGGTGLGKAMALEFAKSGARVAISGRRMERLEEALALIQAAGGEGLALQCDVSDEESVKGAVDQAAAAFGGLDIVIANAGFGVGGPLVDLDAAGWRRQLDVNVVGAALTARHAFPHLRATKGRLALVSSVAAFVPTPGSGAYSASKYAVRAIGQVLAAEWAGEGISVTLLHPGFVKSEIGQVDNEGVFQETWEDKRPASLMWETEDAGRVMVRAIRKRKREYVFTAHGQLGAFLGMHFPGLVHFILTRFAKPRATAAR